MSHVKTAAQREVEETKRMCIRLENELEHLIISGLTHTRKYRSLEAKSGLYRQFHELARKSVQCK